MWLHHHDITFQNMTEYHSIFHFFLSFLFFWLKCDFFFCKANLTTIITNLSAILNLMVNHYILLHWLYIITKTHLKITFFIHPFSSILTILVWIIKKRGTGIVHPKMYIFSSWNCSEPLWLSSVEHKRRHFEKFLSVHTI